MTGWRRRAVGVVIALVGLTGCTSDGGATGGEPDRTASTSRPTASASPKPAPSGGVVPAVMLSSVIRTPDGPIDTGIAHPATFIQTQTGFVVQGTHGTTYAIEGGVTRPISHSDPRLLRLVADPGARFVAFASTRPHFVRVYDSVADAVVLDTAIEAPGPCAGVRCLVLDDAAVYAAVGPSAGVGRYPYAGGPATNVHRLTRALSLSAEGRLSPAGRYVTTLGQSGRLAVRAFHGGREVTPDLPGGPVRRLVWLGPGSFTVEVESASLISPPDGDAWHLLRCSIASGRCETALASVTGTALSIPGTPIRSAPPGQS